ncbi:hypothetical protein K443DRAFT_9777 [Laccaria amethystina LaAM-08-1]|uniref:Unplaced genomic scaffold K443scaffold_154, whole genome shotgun sequence n=1 Tax=Laccaria amethystina LaAM-08-1 TaxID=1095629 RepID=A0A0C9XJ21_9AGAR|nr:hypothetical protein K443DRAFT_9777 [Laccaria amethystina LaAM-08-1]
MFIPTAQKNVTAREVDDSPLPYFGDGGSWSGLLLVFFLLSFYALALWDRWLQLKMAESRRLQVVSKLRSDRRNYSIAFSISQTLEITKPFFH